MKETNVETNVAKVSRRGVAAARGTTRLKFSHEQAKQNGLFIAHLDSVAVSTITIGEDKTGMPSFNGMEIPKITFTFASNEEDANKRHYVSLVFNAVESNVNTIPGGKEEWKVNSVFDWFKHILNVYVLNGRELTDEEADALSLPFEDFNENGEYEAIEPEVVIAGWKVLFENMANIMNAGRDGNPYYKTPNGKFIPVWIKLLRYVKSRNKGWSPVADGNLAFPAFVGEGCIELYAPNKSVCIRIDSVKEAIIPMNIEKAKTPNMPMPGGIAASSIGGVGNIPSMPVMSPSYGDAGINSIETEAAEDMPF